MADRPRWPREVEVRIPELPKIPFGAVAILIAVIAVVILGWLSFYQVDTKEEAVVLRLGRYLKTTTPGLRFKIPIIDQVYILPVKEQRKQEFGFRTERAGVRTRYSPQDYDGESLMLTGDLNVADVEWTVQYRITNPRDYLFRVRNPEDTLRDLSEAVMRQIVGDHSVDEVITIGRVQIAEEAKTLLQDLCNRYEIGLTIDQLVLQDVNPPKPVQPSFNEVNQAIQQREQLINQAEAEYNRDIPRARGEAEQRIRAAEGYAVERVNNAKGETARFVALYGEYRKAPQVTRRRLYLEAVQRVLPRAPLVIVDDDVSNLLPLLQLGGAPAASVPASQPKGGQ